MKDGDGTRLDTIRPSRNETVRGWLISLAAWFTLFSAVVCYGAVALSPKLLTYLQLRHQRDRKQVQLVALEHEARYLAKVNEALEHDPEFAAELARIDFDAVRPGDERIPVDESLALSSPSPWPQGPPRVEFPWYTPAVEVLASQTRLRTTLLVAAAFQVLIAFTCLNESSSPQVGRAWAAVRTRGQRFVQRYRRSHD